MIDLSNKCWKSVKLHLLRRREHSRTAGGVTLSKDLGPALWQVTLGTKGLPFDEADALYAQLLQAETNTLLIRASDKTWQPNYKGDLSNVRVGSVGDDRIGFSGLPSGCVLGAGARFSVATEKGYELFTTLDPSNTGGGPRVVPNIRAVAVNDQVGLTPPVLEVNINPGSIEVQDQALVWRRVSFTGIQVIR